MTNSAESNKLTPEILAIRDKNVAEFLDMIEAKSVRTTNDRKLVALSRNQIPGIDYAIDSVLLPPLIDTDES